MRGKSTAQWPERSGVRMQTYGGEGQAKNCVSNWSIDIFDIVRTRLWWAGQVGKSYMNWIKIGKAIQNNECRKEESNRLMYAEGQEDG